MNENLKVTDSRGVPTLKALWLGIIIDGDDPPNRHLKLAGFQGKELFLELTEVPYDPLGEDEDEEEVDLMAAIDPGAPIDYTETDVDENGIPIPYIPADFEEDDEPEEECDRYPDGCEACQDGECNGPDSELPDEDETYVELSLAYREKPEGEWIGIIDDDAAANPALCRFLNAINEAHGL